MQSLKNYISQSHTHTSIPSKIIFHRLGHPIIRYCTLVNAKTLRLMYSNSNSLVCQVDLQKENNCKKSSILKIYMNLMNDN